MRKGNSVFGRPRLWAVVAALVAIGSSLVIVAPSNAHSNERGILVRGGGTTIVEGGAPGFIPVLTKIAFSARRHGSVVTGSFECLALAPASPAGPQSGEFNVNAMYVTGQVTGLTVRGKTATLTGTATITGLGAGSDVAFEFVVEDGGPGAKAVLTTAGAPSLVFNELLVEGDFAVAKSDD